MLSWDLNGLLLGGKDDVVKIETNLITQDPDIEVDLRHPDWVRGGAVKVKALVVLIPVALGGVHHVVTRGGLYVLSIPASRELDVDLEL